MKVLVSGVAGDIGLNIGRILRRSCLNVQLIGGDIHSEFIADDVFETTYTLPHAGLPSYSHDLRGLVDAHEIDIFIPTSEAELRWLSANPAEVHRLGAHCLMASTKAMEIGFDKYQTAQHLRAHGLPSPWSCLVDDPEGPPEIPCILKSGTGSGNSSVYIVRDSDKLPYYRYIFPDYIWQQYLSDALGEFTCGVYRCLDGSTRVIVMKRRLNYGITSYGQIVHNESIEKLCKDIARSLDLCGSINVQLRVLEGSGPMVFEINPRFSSTVGVRDRLGFSDVIWSIQEQYLRQSASAAPNEYPLAIFSRRFDEFGL